jgi:hypothetical protein
VGAPVAAPTAVAVSAISVAVYRPWRDIDLPVLVIIASTNRICMSLPADEHGQNYGTTQHHYSSNSNGDYNAGM